MNINSVVLNIKQSAMYTRFMSHLGGLLLRGKNCGGGVMFWAKWPFPEWRRLNRL